MSKFYCLCPICFNKVLKGEVPETELEGHRRKIEATKEAFKKENSNQDITNVVMDFASDRRTKRVYLTGSESYRYTRWSVFNVTHCSKEGEERAYDYFDVISSLSEEESGLKVKHDSLYVINGLKEVFERMGREGLLKRIISIWSDNGRHFKNKVVVNYLISLVGETFDELRMRFFERYHGKSICDRHFGNISRTMREYSGDIITYEGFESVISSIPNTRVIELNEGGIAVDDVPEEIDRVRMRTDYIRISIEDETRNKKKVAMICFNYSSNEFEKEEL